MTTGRLYGLFRNLRETERRIEKELNRTTGEKWEVFGQALRGSMRFTLVQRTNNMDGYLNNLMTTAQQVINKIVEKEYGGDRAALEEEVGDLDEYALRIVEAMEQNELSDEDDVDYIVSVIDLYL